MLNTAKKGLSSAVSSAPLFQINVKTLLGMQRILETPDNLYQRKHEQMKRCAGHRWALLSGVQKPYLKNVYSRDPPDVGRMLVGSREELGSILQTSGGSRE